MPLDHPDTDSSTNQVRSTHAAGHAAERDTSRHFERLLVACILLVSACLGLASLWTDGPTFDEPVYLMAGHSYWKHGDFSFNSEHPPLWKELATLPLVIVGAGGDRLDPWAAENGMDAHTVFLLARLPIFLLFLAGGFLVYRWSKQLWGRGGGALSLFLYAFSPNLLAFSRLVTPDFPVTFFYLASSYAFWGYARQPSRARFFWVAAALGGALTCRYTAFLLLPGFAIILALALRKPSTLGLPATQSHSEARQWTCVLIIPLAILVASLPFVSLTYGFVGAGHFFTGLAKFFTHATSEGHHAYLMGEYSQSGWWHYFLIVLALKVPLPVWLIFGAALLLSRSGTQRPTEVLFFAVPAGVLLLAASINKVNLGMRLVLPILPLIFVWSGRLAAVDWVRGRIGRVAVGGLVLWLGTGALRIHPHYLSYFNELVGPEEGYKYLSDSNVDWGQDLPRLGAFLRDQNVQGVLLAYYGLAPAGYYGIQAQYLPTGDSNKDTLAWVSSMGYFHTERPRLLAISATLLKGVPLEDASAYSWLEAQKPAARIGYSIFVYDITDDPDASRHLIRVYERAPPPEREDLKDAFQNLGAPYLAGRERELVPGESARP